MAFARGAMSIVWGCNWSRPYYDILNQTMKQLGSKVLEDKTQFVFSWREGTGGHVYWFKKIMGLPDDPKTLTKGTATTTVKLAKGTYTFYCSVDSHKAAGMVGTLKVS